MSKLKIYKSVAFRPLSATQMLLNHKRTLKYLWKQKMYRSLYNHVFTTYLVRGEDCGKGVLDPVWKLTGKAPFLWDVEMETTTACYLKCTHCEHTYWPDKTYLNQHLQFATLARVINGIPNLHWVNLTGEGTSVLNPDFQDMVQYIKGKGIYLDFSHDFVKLSDKMAQEWVDYGVDRIYWSFDGVTKCTYEKIRVGANFEQVCGNVQKLIQAKKGRRSPLPEICFRYCFFKDNIKEVEYIPAFLMTLVDKIHDYGDEPSINIVALLEFEETKDWAVEISQDIIKQTEAISKYLGFKVYWSHVTHIEEEKAPMDYCTFWSEPYIMITGHVVPCCAVLMSNNRPNLEKLAFGNIHEQSLKDIWNSGHYRKFRKMVVDPQGKVPAICLGCRVFNTHYRAKRYGVWKG